MAFLISSDDDDLIHATTHGIMNRDDLAFLRDRMDTAMKMAGSTANNYLRQASERLSNFNLSGLRSRVDAMRERFGKRWDEDRVVSLKAMAEFQNARPTNRRYLMADVRTRTLFQQGRIEGYAELYEDEEPGAIGMTHTPWREVNNGAYQEEVLDEDQFRHCLGVMDEEGEQPLEHFQRMITRFNQKTIGELLDMGRQDPTSIRRNVL